MTARLHLATGAAEVLASLRRSLAGDEVTAPLPADEPERAQTVAMLRPDLPVAEPDAAAVVATSGSTGRPRGVVLPGRALLASARATHDRLEGPGTWVLALPAHYVAGLMVLVRALVAGRGVHLTDGRLTGLAALNLGEGPAYVSLVPTQLARALADPAAAAALRRFSAVLLGGTAADPDLLQRATDADVRAVTTYGMSETCGGCVYDGRALDGVEVDTDADGRITIGGPTLFGGYRLDPAATDEALADGRLRTRDRGVLRPDGRLEVLGRVDDVVVTGGMNVDLAAVERAVTAWVGRQGAEAAVVGIPDADWGTVVVAVTAHAGHNRPRVDGPTREPGAGPSTRGRFSLSELRSALSADLPAYALPRRLVSRASLPRTAGGKIDRRRLVAELGRPTKDRL